MSSIPSYNPDFFSHLFKIEERHFWFRSRNRVIGTLMRQILQQSGPGSLVLEVGCGTGNTLRVLEQVGWNSTVVGMDLFAEGLKYGRQRTACPLVQGDISFPPFRTQFDVIGLFDVLEHLADDSGVLHEVRKLLKPEGRLVLTVPAHPSLWSYFDEASRHVRRYRPAELQQKLIDCGYSIEYCTQYMMVAFPLMWLTRRLTAARRPHATSSDAHQAAADELRIMPGVNALLSLLLALEIPWITGRRKLPFGTSLLVSAIPRP